MGLEFIDFLPDTFERGLRILECRQDHTPPVRFLVWGTLSSPGGHLLLLLLLVGGVCGWRLLQNCGVTQRFLRSSFRLLDFWCQLVRNFVIRKCQGIFLCFVDTFVLLIEVKEVRGEGQRFLPDMGDRLPY